MPNASKKDVKPKLHKVTNALDYARGFVASVGDKNMALSKAEGHKKAALAAPMGPDTNTANFWQNIIGHIGKLTFILLFLNGCSEVPKDSKATGTLHLERIENDEVICYGFWQQSLQCKWKDKK